MVFETPRPRARPGLIAPFVGILGDLNVIEALGRTPGARAEGSTGEDPQPGQIVRVRQRRYCVDEVIPRRSGDDATLVRLSCLDDDAQGQHLEVLWEKEVDPEVLSAESWRDLAARGFDLPKTFSAYLHTLRWNCVTATDPRLSQSPFRSARR